MPRYKLVNGERIQLTAQEEADRDAEEQAWTNGAFDRAIADVRAKRDNLLKASDWEVIMAKEKGTTLSAGFKTYRQDLRDITEGVSTVEDVNNITWPTKP
jgi:hypothetical protein